MYLFVGLCNPGPEYAKTRHNLGALFLEYYLKKELKPEKKIKALVTTLQFHATKSWVILPQTFMNLSGDSVAAAMKYFDIPREKIIVFHDEIELEEDVVQHKFGGGHKGHNGLRDIGKKIGSLDFHRVRLGVGRPQNGETSVADYLLAKYRGPSESFLKSIAEFVETELISKIS